MLMCIATAVWISCAPVPHPEDASWTLPRIVDRLHEKSIPTPAVAAAVIASGHVALAEAIASFLAKAAQEKNP
jgi:hypothetical protein